MNIQTLPVVINPSKMTEVHLLAIKEDGTLVGLTQVGLTVGENAGWINNVFVQPDERGRGFGRRLLERAFEVCKEDGRAFASLVVANDNEVAKKLYESLGFVPFMDGTEGHTQYIKTL